MRFTDELFAFKSFERIYVYVRVCRAYVCG